MNLARGRGLAEGGQASAAPVERAAGQRAWRNSPISRDAYNSCSSCRKSGSPQCPLLSPFYPYRGYVLTALMQRAILDHIVRDLRKKAASVGSRAGRGTYPCSISSCLLSMYIFFVGI